jgi:hypothetical protein
MKLKMQWKTEEVKTEEQMFFFLYVNDTVKHHFV